MAVSGGDERSGGSRRLKTEETEDRLSALPDSLIHHILSFLPSTKQAIQTGILSKRWLNQWNFVSSLFFNFSNRFSDYSRESTPLTTYAISGIMNQTLSLHQCSKLHRFHFITDQFCRDEYDPSFEDKIRFVVGKQVEELILSFSDRMQFRLPEFFFCQPSLVKLQLFWCSVMPTGMVDWKSLKDLSIGDCRCSCEVIKSIMSGSPMLQSLDLKNGCCCGGRFVIASKSLKTLVVNGSGCCVDIWCPNLVEFYGEDCNFGWCDKVVEKFLSDSPLLEVLELRTFQFKNLRIASTTLKRFIFSLAIKDEIQISCPHLEELDLTASIRKIRLMNLPSSICAFLDLVCNKECDGPVAKHILEQLQHLNELRLGSFFIESLSALEKVGTSHPLLNCKSLTLQITIVDSRYFHIPGIAYVLRSSPLLERLVVKLQPREFRFFGIRWDDDPEENYWSSNGTHFSNLVSSLRTVEITGFSQREYKCKIVLDFVEFLLKNASMLEKMVVILEDRGSDFANEVSQKLLSFPRCSNADIELLCST